jgi:hypothetical protein
VSLLDLIDLLSINVSKVVDALGDSISPQLTAGDTLDEALLTLLNATFNDGGRNTSFTAFLNGMDAHYLDLTPIVLKHNVTADTFTDLSAAAGSTNVTNDVPLRNGGDTVIYFGSTTIEDLLGSSPGSNFSALNFAIGTPNTDPLLPTIYQWEYYNGSAWLNLPILNDTTANMTQSGRIFFTSPTSMQPLIVNGTETHWIRVNITAPLAGVGPIADTVDITFDYVPYYLAYLAGQDLFGRATGEAIPGESDSFNNLLRTMSSSNGYALLIWSLLSYRGVTFPDFVDEIGGEFATVAVPVMGPEVASTSALFVGAIVYGLLLLGVVAALGGRKGSYAISPIRVKKWYESQMVTPSLKTREELEKMKSISKG